MPDALRYALKLLSYRGRSENELSERLARKGFPQDEMDSAIGRLRAMGYIDDAALAETLKRTALDIKLLGREGARRFLRQRGIRREDIDKALKGYDEFDSALKLASKKGRALNIGGARSPNIAGARSPLAAALQRRGFSADTIRKVIKSDKEAL